MKPVSPISATTEFRVEVAIAAQIIGGSKANIILAGTSGAQLTLSGLNTYGGYTEITAGILSTTTLAIGGSGNPSGIGEFDERARQSHH